MLASIPNLDEIARDPVRLQGLDAPTLAGLALKVNAVGGMIAAEFARVATSAPSPQRPTRVVGQNGPTVSADEAAALLHKPRRWLFSHADRLPFVRRISRKHLVCDEGGLRAWIAAHGNR